jgi:hypothetical protein
MRKGLLWVVGLLLVACGPEDEGTDPQGAGAAGWWKPKPGTSWQIQLNGALDTSLAVDVYDVDLFDTPAATITALHQRGHKVICYFNAGAHEDWRPDAADFPGGVVGSAMEGWAGERWVDIRSLALRKLLRARLDLAVQKGCDGVDPDNVDGYLHRTGFPLTAEDQLTFNRFLAEAAHARGLAVGLKNDMDQVPQLVQDFDWQLNEECFQRGECESLRPFIDAGKPVFSIEYGDASLAQRVCPQARALGFSTLVKPLELGAERIACEGAP